MKQVARQNLARVPGLLLQECTLLVGHWGYCGFYYLKEALSLAVSEILTRALWS